MSATTLFFVVVNKRWGWNRMTAGLLAACFFVANMSKIFHGAWFALAIGGFFSDNAVLENGAVKFFGNKMQSLTPKTGRISENAGKKPPQRINGQAVFLARSHDFVPAALMHNLKHNKILHSDVIFLNIRTEEIPRVPNFEKIEPKNWVRGFTVSLPTTASWKSQSSIPFSPCPVTRG